MKLQAPNFTTEDEIEFIGQLHRRPPAKPQLPSPLELYHQALLKRVHWGLIDRGRVIAHCRALLHGG